MALCLCRDCGLGLVQWEPLQSWSLSLLVFVLFQEVLWKEKELCWPVWGMSV